MRPKQLVISGWGPYRDEQKVDFEKLGGSGLFLITGPTGAGKTTIFDAITFALYGKVSGSTRQTTQLRSDFAVEDRETFVEFFFTHKGKSYRVKRSPAYQRKKKRGDGWIREKEKAELLLPDGTAVEGNLSVGQALEKLLGMDAEQFRQLSMIAQGEFMRLLLAKGEERRSIFRQIFRLGRFEQMQKKIAGRESQLEEKVRHLRSRMLEEAREAAGEDETLAACLGADSADWSEFLPTLEKKIADKEKTEEQAEADYRSLSERAEKLSGEIREKERINRELEDLKIGYRKRQKLEECRPVMEKNRFRAEWARRAAELDAQAASLQGLRNRLKEQTEKYEGASKEQEKLEERFCSLVLEYETLKEQEPEEKVRTVRIRDLEALLEQIQKLREEECRLHRMQSRYVQLERYGQSARSTYERMDRAYRAAAVGLAARYLEDGKPCPVCGSTVHPHKAVVTDEVPDETALAKAKKEAESAEKKVAEAAEQAIRQRGITEEKENSVSRGMKELGIEKENQETCEEELEKLLSRWKRESSKYKEQAEKIYPEYELCERKLTEIRTVKKECQEELHMIRKNLEEQEKAFLQTLGEKKFADSEGSPSEKMWREASLPKKELHMLEEEIRKFDRQVLLLEGQISVQEEKTKGCVQIDLSEDREHLSVLKEEADFVRKEQSRLHAELQMWKKSLFLLQKNLKEGKVLEEEYRDVSSVSRTVSGRNLQNLTFEDYVIAGYFDRILEAANLRLRKMTEERYELSRVDRAADQRSRDSLEVQVMDHHTGKYRGVRTLSGGESFKAALSMALGMADVIRRSSGGIEIETLFIDEGFGSLDTESLDQAVETLLEMAEYGQLIGIISHVAELKERVDEQIVVERHPDGSRIRTGG